MLPVRRFLLQGAPERALRKGGFPPGQLRPVSREPVEGRKLLGGSVEVGTRLLPLLGLVVIWYGFSARFLLVELAEFLP